MPIGVWIDTDSRRAAQQTKQHIKRPSRAGYQALAAFDMCAPFEALCPDRERRALLIHQRLHT
jgi:hypothetical protein